MALKLGRPLQRDERVIHINGDKHDNRPENLAVQSYAEWIRESNRRAPRRKRGVVSPKEVANAAAKRQARASRAAAEINAMRARVGLAPLSASADPGSPTD